MNTKLTLSLDSAVIKDAKKNLQTKDRSLSRIIEDYFKALLASKNKNVKNSLIVDELTGIASLAKNNTERDTVAEYLLEKYK